MATDGPAGHVSGLLLHAGSWRVTALEVRKGLFRKKLRQVRIEAVARTTDTRVTLMMQAQDVWSNPLVRLDQGGPQAAPGEPDASRRSNGRTAPEAAAARRIHADQVVMGIDGPVGRVELVFLDRATHRMTHVVVRQKERRVIVPVACIAELDQDGFVLDATHAAIAQLQEYRPDSELRSLIAAIPWRTTALRTAMPNETMLRVEVDDGTATLHGHALDDDQSGWIELLIRAVPGVRGIRNTLVVDRDLELQVAQVLWREPRLEDVRISVWSRFGFVYLSGDVATARRRVIAEDAAGSVAGIRAIINRITVRGALVAPAQLPAQMHAGQTIYDSNLDHAVGSVETVLIDARRQRVTGFVARLEDVSVERGSRYGLFAGQPKQIRHVVVPMAHVRNASIGGVFLTLQPGAVASLKVFDRAAYQAPAEHWQPPFPYRRTDVLLETESVVRTSIPDFNPIRTDGSIRVDVLTRRAPVEQTLNPVAVAAAS